VAGVVMTDRRPPPVWHERAQGWRADVGLAVAVGVAQVVGTYFAGSRHSQSGRKGLDALAFVLLAAGPAALVARRRAPALVLATVFGATLAYDLIGYPRGPIFLALIVAFVTAVRAGRRRAAWSLLAIGYVSFVWLSYLIGWDPRPDWGEILGVAAWLLVLGTVTEVARGRRERAVEAWHAREEEARRRASEERVRIAQELHDVLAHNISLINVQAGVALHLMDEQPEQARSALTAIKGASKEALSELRSVLGVLRQDDEEAPRSPAPRLDRLDGLVSRAQTAGLTVRTEVEGTPRPLPAGVDLAAYRIVQEALTNVTRHAGAAAATVRVVYGEGAVTVEVDDDGRGPGSRAPGGGNGIPGMRERAAALGGVLEAGPRPGGGFRVRAWLPVDAS
jgi:signal transduction histidine kinase